VVDTGKSDTLGLGSPKGARPKESNRNNQWLVDDGGRSVEAKNVTVTWTSPTTLSTVTFDILLQLGLCDLLPRPNVTPAT
jgi:hypothetical protein